MSENTRTIADRATFQAFMNCYLREIDQGVWHNRYQWQLQTGAQFHHCEDQVLELQLPHLNRVLAVGVRFRSLVGRHTLTSALQKHHNEEHWQEINSLSAILILINHIYHDRTEQQSAQLELISRLIESHLIMVRYLDERLYDERLLQHNFIDSEQSLLFGHWLHPTPKSRQGILDWQHKHYTPDLCSRFPLHYFAVDRSLVQQNSALDIEAESLIQQMLQDTPLASLSEPLAESLKDKVLIPTHPFQAQWLLHQGAVIQKINDQSIIDLGQSGPLFTPTSSVRTLFHEQQPYMFKFSIPVKITNSMRVNQHHELEAGVVIAKLFKTLHFSQHFPQFQIIADPAYLRVQLNGEHTSGFEVIIRENPFFQPKNPGAHSLEDKIKVNGEQVQSIAALVQDAITPGTTSKLKTLIQALSKKRNLSIKNSALMWFEQYWHCAIEPAIQLYDQHGIALEAHQQNSLLQFCDGLPVQYYFRDNQGFYLSNHHKQHLLDTEPSLDASEELFYDDNMIQDRFGYYLFVNQLFSIINRMGIDQLISESTLVEFCQKKLLALMENTHGVGQQFIQRSLQRRQIPCKGNLLTRIDDLDELQAELEMARYTFIPNPLHLNNLTDIQPASCEVLREYA